MKENIDVNELVIVKQLPEIIQQLDKVNELVISKVQDIDKTLNEISLMSEEEQDLKKNEIKKYKTYLNSLKTELENKRKEVKNAINKPYEEFEKIYKEKTTKILDEGIYKLSTSITTIEQRQLEEKRNELVEFFEEYIEYYHIDGIVNNLNQVPIKINLSTSLKSLKEEIIKFCKKISDDLVCIVGEDKSIIDEVLYEYQSNGFDYAKAIQTTRIKRKQQEELQKKMKQVEEVKEVEKEVIDVVNEVTAPQEIVEEETIELTFTVKSTREKLRELRDFMKEKEIDYR